MENDEKQTSTNTERTTFKVLFVCTGNTCRSPMAEAAFRKLLEKESLDNIEALSAGVGAAVGCPASRFAHEAVRIWDADLSEHSAQQLTRELIDQSDLIIAMTPGHFGAILQIAPEAFDKTYLLKNFPDRGDRGDGVTDPIGMTLDIYNEVFLDIATHLERMLPLTAQMAREKSRSATENNPDTND